MGVRKIFNTKSDLKLSVIKQQVILEWVYSVNDTPWDTVAFKLLHHLFQMTVIDVTGIGIPITISKLWLNHNNLSSPFFPE
ncbi:MAG: hypothetical protein D8M57_16620 [Candidatus Scalindua sp. AMX11]|nr:MAG: hypothetical protein DWQ00_06635 [Candidatus Scalindua sp.]NOG84257.1 hypothetical protein [Planctomycetota bacterium]RZV68290.1 MAG: hypothetical protein EX341_16600 [Candidatus Scalindua sp. SCAELEC01]TDE63763.1 MAG: hypothetical protein D8M57_16620 [Candidatus Scalindua sp. AMX11]